MSNLQTAQNPQIKIHNGRAATTSRNIATVFGKRHRDVLRDVKSLDIPQEFAERNFALCSYKGSNGQAYKMHEVTRDGFTLLAMGFTGKKAMQFKLGYIAAFNAMESELLKKHEQPAPSGTVSAAELRRLRVAVYSAVHDGYPKVLHQTMFNRIYGRLHTAFDIREAKELPADRLDEALQSVQAEWVPDAASPAKADTVPDSMVLVRRDNLNALNNRCQLASTRYKAIDEIERRAARLATDAEELRRQMVDFRYLTIDPVREASAIASDMLAA